MRKTNLDTNYNHKINQYTNLFLLEFDQMVYSLISGLVQSDNNKLILSKGITKVSIDNKAAVPIGEPNCPICTGVCKLSNSLMATLTAGQLSAMDHNFH